MKVAGGMPCIALTALAGLEALKVTSEQTLLVFGASYRRDDNSFVTLTFQWTT
jgi:hypothetical protein